MLHICNPYFEWELSSQCASTFEETSLQHPIFTQLQFLPLLYGAPEDGLIVSAKPDPAFFETVKLQMPRALYFPEEPLPPHAQLSDWGASQLIAKWAKERGLAYGIPDWDLVQQISSKLFSFQQSPLPGAARILNRADLDQFLKKTKGPVVLKDCLESSGRGHFFFFPNKPVDERTLNAFLMRNHPLIAEPWVERIIDYSTQWEITKKGDIQYLGLTICHNDAHGRYRGNEVGHLTFTADIGVHQTVIEEIAQKGFFGNIGIDAMIYNTDSGPQLQPVVEINPRKTMGYVALQFQRRHFPGQHLFLSFSDNAASNLLPQSVTTRNGARVKFRKSLSYKLYT